MASKAVIALLALIATLAKGDLDYDKAFPMPDLEVPHIPLPNGIPSPRIVGGVESVPNSRPYQVGLFLPVAEGLSFCGGSLITPQTVLTAAHCVDSLVGPVEVVLGAHLIRQVESTQVRISTSDISIHPEWDRGLLRNDIAVVRLPSAVQLNANIQTITLARGSATFQGSQALVSGWGRDSDESQVISSVLREVEVPIISNTICNIAYLGLIQNSHICASGNGGKSTCNGDSGGPLVVDGIQVGVVSFGLGLGCEIGWPSAYARVTSYADWIERNSI